MTDIPEAALDAAEAALRAEVPAANRHDAEVTLAAGLPLAGRCATCRYWRRGTFPWRHLANPEHAYERPYEDGGAQYSECMRVAGSENTAYTDADLMDWDTPPMRIDANDEWGLRMQTRADFGCTEWKATA
jgi:hypothetical protein